MKFGKKKEKEEDSLSPSKKEKKEKKEKDKKDKKSKKDGSNDSSSATSTAASPQPPTNVSAPSGKVFGSRLIDNMEIPPIIIQTIEYLEANALQTPGIFRESGSQQQIMQYRTLFEQEKPVVFQPHECHVVASILKLYLRGLQDPLLSFENYNMFVACESINDEKVKLEVVKKVLKLLPLTNLKVLKYIFEFLVKVVANSETNKMTTDSLSVVFLPTILRPEAHTDQEVLQFTVEDSKSTKTLMATIICNYESIFEDNSLFVRTRQTRAITEFCTTNPHVKYPQQLNKAPLPPPPTLSISPGNSSASTPSLISPRTISIPTPSPLPAIPIPNNNSLSNTSPNITPSSTPTSSAPSTPSSSSLLIATTTATASTSPPPPPTSSPASTTFTSPPPFLEIPTSVPFTLPPIPSSHSNSTLSIPTSSLPPSTQTPLSPTPNATEEPKKSLPALPDKRNNLKTPPPLPAKPPTLFVPKPLPRVGEAPGYNNKWFGEPETRPRSSTTAV